MISPIEQHKMPNKMMSQRAWPPWGCTHWYAGSEKRRCE